MSSKLEFTESSGNVFKDAGFSEQEAKNLQLRSALMTALVKYIQSENITQKEAARRFGVSQPRVSNLIHGRIDLFSTGMLLDMMELAGFDIFEKIEDDVEEIVENQAWLGVVSNCTKDHVHDHEC